MARLAGLAVPPRRSGGPKTSPQPSRQACTSAPPAGAGVGGRQPPIAATSPPFVVPV